jgi:secreted trypsin-like serine protease
MFCQVSVGKCAISMLIYLLACAAAHCFQQKYVHQSPIKPAQYVTAWIGKFNFSITDEEGSVGHAVYQVIIHDGFDYKEDSSDGDLAIVVLTENVNLELVNAGTICLSPATSDQVSGNGIIVGWGVSERSVEERERHSMTPNEVQLPAITLNQCVDADHRFQTLLSNRTFCGGYQNQAKSACQGDSGGGFFQLDESTGTFRLVGIISASLYDPFGDCRSDIYSVFTDVSKFIPWIREKMEETMNVQLQNVSFNCMG